MDGWMVDKWMDGWMDGMKEEWMARWMNGSVPLCLGSREGAKMFSST